MMNESITITDAAANETARLIAEEKIPDLKLRISIEGGGCSGFQYAFEFDAHKNDNDIAIEKNNITVLVDETSMVYLKGSTIDYEESLEGAGFVVDNPNSKSGCGCGNSFGV